MFIILLNSIEFLIAIQIRPIHSPSSWAISAAVGSHPLREELLESCGFPKDTELTKLHLQAGAKEMNMTISMGQKKVGDPKIPQNHPFQYISVDFVLFQ